MAVSNIRRGLRSQLYIIASDVYKKAYSAPAVKGTALLAEYHLLPRSTLPSLCTPKDEHDEPTMVLREVSGC